MGEVRHGIENGDGVLENRWAKGTAAAGLNDWVANGGSVGPPEDILKNRLYKSCLHVKFLYTIKRRSGKIGERLDRLMLMGAGVMTKPGVI